MGFFASFCQDSGLEFFLISIVIFSNFWFLVVLVKIYLQIKIAFSTKTSRFTKGFEQFWEKGDHFLMILINLNQEIKNLESSIIKSEKYFKTEISKIVSKSRLKSVKMKDFNKKAAQKDKKGY